MGKFPNSVLEIGGGYGTPARAWLTSSPGEVRRYAILDVAESLFFAEVFLRAHFGLDSVSNLADPDASVSAESARVLLCPLERMDSLKTFEFDVVINTGSMQEMTDEWISVYEAYLSDINASYFYSANYFLQPIDKMNESMNLYSPRLRKDWKLLAHDFFPATAESDFRSSLRTLYQHIDAPQIILEEIAKLVESIETSKRDSPINDQLGSDLALFMDAYRRGLRDEDVLRVVRVLENNQVTMVKELAFLVAHLLARSTALAPVDQSWLQILAKQLQALRAKGNEGLSPISHLVGGTS